jgi:predicted PurR-regulated permease PerM
VVLGIPSETSFNAMNMTGQENKLERYLGWGVLLLLLGGCMIVIWHFVSAMLWAIVLSVSSWPLYNRLRKLTGNRRTLAALLMVLGMILILLVPFVVVGVTLADNVSAVSTATRRWIEGGPPEPPAWLAKVPMVGAKAVESWQNLASDTAKLWAQAQKFIEPVSAWLLRAGLALGGGLFSGLFQLALSILIAFFLFRDGVSLAESLTTAVGRIGGERGKHLLTVANKTVRGVVYGILGTALVQAVLAGIGYVIAGVPGPALLALLTFFFSVVPLIGTGLVWIPAALWLFHEGSTGWGIFMLIWGIGVANVDNIVKPWLISQGSEMPFILVFFGVLGGALTFGFIGVFLGPTLLAVGYRLVTEWISVKKLELAEGTTGPPPKPE